VIPGVVTVRTISLLSGPLVLGAYLLGSVPLAHLVRRRRLFRQIEDLGSVGDVAGAIGGTPAQRGREGELAVVVYEALLPVALATVAWHLVESVAPGSGNSFDNISAIGYLSNQALLVWQSIALWVGAAAVAGQVASAFLGLRGGTGIPGVMGLALAYTPITYAVAVLIFFAVVTVTHDHRRAVITALVGAVGWSWIAWVIELDSGWGATHGPELSLWITVVGALAVAGVSRTTDYRSPPPVR